MKILLPPSKLTPTKKYILLEIGSGERFLKKKHDKNAYRLYVSKLFGKWYYLIAISDMYHLHLTNPSPY